ncbi:YitT family protein [Neobacillus novalis]|uniref:YitT family protein n=1 Tax=Neobacillus novalis TaxID=220687 RepID=A0AA95MI20_9BACI|nr:YitT family protein [Neobacillus novalis]WHY84157.1 YitT family protein [Neobacillus novalis]
MKQTVVQTISVTFFTLIMAYALNNFLIPHKVLTGGIAGVAIIINNYLSINTGWIILAINLPLFIIGYIHLGKKFMFLTVYSVVLLSVSMKLIPIHAFSEDILLSSVFGGVLFGLSVGANIRVGASAGGVDIISLILAKKKDMSVGFIITCLNFAIVFVSALVFGVDKTLYTLFAIFASGRAVDAVHTNHTKLTVTIVTDKWKELSEALLKLHPRGITMTDAEGVYSHHPKKVLTTVITKYELAETKETIKKSDPCAFVHITKAIEVMGRFRRD